LIISIKGFRDYDFLNISSIYRERLVYLCVAILFGIGKASRSTLTQVVSFCYLQLLLHRDASTTLICISILLVLVSGEYLKTTSSSILEVILFKWMLGNCIFFASGNSHAIATVDISGAYTGLLEYNQLIVIILCVVITYAGPLLACAGIMSNMASSPNPQKTSQTVRAAVYILQVCCIVRVTLATIVFITMRTHLFVWTVFAPKWTYEAVMFLVSIPCSYLIIWTAPSQPNRSNKK